VTTLERLSAEGISPAVDRAIGFLDRAQLPSGEFRADRYSDRSMTRNAQCKSTPYGTAYVLYSLGFTDNPRSAGLIDRGCRFLLGEMDAPGLWRYFSVGESETLPPDLDDTSCAAYVLKDRHDYLILGLSDRLFLLNRTEDGRFRTFLSTTIDDEVCGLVNANVVLYLGETDETAAACDYLVSLAREGEAGKLSLYGVDDLLFFYALSRAFYHGARRLGSAREATLRRVAARRHDDGSYGGSAMNTALAGLSLLNFGTTDRKSIARTADFLLARQQDDGSWPRDALYVDFDSGFYGSGEITTALCIEALTRSAKALG